MDDEYLNRVQEAVECLEEGDEGNLVRVNENNRRFNILMNRLVSDFPVDPEEMKISRTYLRRKLIGLLETCWHEEDPREEFDQRYGSLIGGIYSSPCKSYRIGFPLNLPEGPDQIDHGGIVITHLDRDEWKSQFQSEAMANSEFKEFMSDSQNSFDRRQTYWKFEHEARDTRFPVNKLEQELEIILGELTYTISHWTSRTVRTSSRIHPYAWSELRLPFVYIVLDGGDYESYFADENPVKRPSITKPALSRSIEVDFSQIPRFQDPDEVDRRIRSGFRNFYLGSTEQNQRDAFFHYWRALENLALVAGDDETDSGDVLTRATSIVDFDEMSSEFGLVADQLTVEDRIRELVAKRNNLVHEGKRIIVERQDNDFLRALFYELVPFMIINRKWKKRNIIFWLENAGSETTDLERKVCGIERNIERDQEEIHLTESIINSRKR